MEKYFLNYDQYVRISYRLSFFNSCKAYKVIPEGLSIEKNVATHVNEEFVKAIEENLNEASSRGLDLIIERFERSKQIYP